MSSKATFLDLSDIIQKIKPESRNPFSEEYMVKVGERIAKDPKDYSWAALPTRVIGGFSGNPITAGLLELGAQGLERRPEISPVEIATMAGLSQLNFGPSAGYAGALAKGGLTGSVSTAVEQQAREGLHIPTPDEQWDIMKGQTIGAGLGAGIQKLVGGNVPPSVRPGMGNIPPTPTPPPSPITTLGQQRGAGLTGATPTVQAPRVVTTEPTIPKVTLGEQTTGTGGFTVPITKEGTPAAFFQKLPKEFKDIDELVQALPKTGNDSLNKAIERLKELKTKGNKLAPDELTESFGLIDTVRNHPDLDEAWKNTWDYILTRGRKPPEEPPAVIAKPPKVPKAPKGGAATVVPGIHPVTGKPIESAGPIRPPSETGGEGSNLGRTSLDKLTPSELRYRWNQLYRLREEGKATPADIAEHQRIDRMFDQNPSLLHDQPLSDVNKPPEAPKPPESTSGEFPVKMAYKMPEDTRSLRGTSLWDTVLGTKLTGHSDLDAKISRMKEIVNLPEMNESLWEELRTLGSDQVSRDPRMPKEFRRQWNQSSSAPGSGVKAPIEGPTKIPTAKTPDERAARTHGAFERAKQLLEDGDSTGANRIIDEETKLILQEKDTAGARNFKNNWDIFYKDFFGEAAETTHPSRLPSLDDSITIVNRITNKTKELDKALRERKFDLVRRIIDDPQFKGDLESLRDKIDKETYDLLNEEIKIVEDSLNQAGFRSADTQVPTPKIEIPGRISSFPPDIEERWDELYSLYRDPKPNTERLEYLKSYFLNSFPHWDLRQQAMFSEEIDRLIRDVDLGKGHKSLDSNDPIRDLTPSQLQKAIMDLIEKKNMEGLGNYDEDLLDRMIRHDRDTAAATSAEFDKMRTEGQKPTISEAEDLFKEHPDWLDQIKRFLEDEEGSFDPFFWVRFLKPKSQAPTTPQVPQVTTTWPGQPRVTLGGGGGKPPKGPPSITIPGPGSSGELPPGKPASWGARDVAKWAGQWGQQGLAEARQAMTTADLSWLFRQGINMVTHPSILKKNLRPMWEAFKSEHVHTKIMKDIMSQPRYPQMKNAGLDYADIDGKARHENLRGILLEKFGWGPFKPVRMANRAFTTMGNKVMSDFYNSMADDLEKLGIELGDGNNDNAKTLASLVNDMTGRGNLRSYEKSAEKLNKWIFSPKLIASRVNMFKRAFGLDGKLLEGADPVAARMLRKEAMNSMLAIGGLALTSAGLSSIANGKTETADPFHGDFAKFKIGNIRFDFTGGYGNYVRTAAQLVFNMTNRERFNEPEPGFGAWEEQRRDETLLRFLGGKLAPLPSGIWEFFRERTYTGEPFELTEAIKSRTTPMITQALEDVAREDPKMLIPAVPASILGVGVQAYGPRTPTRRRIGPVKFNPPKPKVVVPKP